MVRLLGFIVEFGAGVLVLVHISELTNARIHHPAEVVTAGDLVTATVLRIDPLGHKVGLSLRWNRRG